ncbi:hypothetical protein A1OQ_04395 [Enterovibrio norvegicus FF-162]|uniref:hypothetical protein n=1 Tax=Enterovibrio norvegicus TaxID=188144 RepID=UPI0002D6C44C|nr:hypothetical protein [Enterovibrio norvegicus]OEE82027.1 hypothetical protein A1OQ_04395 [Enterovibrio norvegicus FF-162]
MNFKTSLLAASVALVLAGCGSDDSAPVVGADVSSELAKKPNIAIPENGRFIDAQVEGLYFVQGMEGGDGWTTADGSYDIDTSNPSVRFVLGNEHGGLLLGNISGRHISTPYEALGTQDRAIALVRLLLTINENADDAAIRIPTEIRNAIEGSTIIATLKAIELDRLDNTASNFLSALAAETGERYELVSENDAMDHLKGSLENLERGSDTKLTHWAKGSNWTFVSRSASQRFGQRSESDEDNISYKLIIHADRTLGDEMFEKTYRSASSIFTLKEDNYVARSGSNDSSISSYYSTIYMSCVADNKTFAWVEEGEGENLQKLPACNGDTNYQPKPEFNNVGFVYDYELVDPNGVITEDEAYSWDEVVGMGAMYKCMADANCSEKSLTNYQVSERDDSHKNERSKMLRETQSGSYDPITDVYTETRVKEYLNGNNKGRIAESISFTYPVEKVGDDRHVDFIGSWKATALNPLCPEMVAEATFTFRETGLTMSGEELNTNENGCYISTYEEEEYPYNELAGMDYWWFGTNKAGASKATLDQLNSTVRWNDRDDNENQDNFKINRFSYIPAGSNWDQGIFYRFTLNDNGNKIATETLRKIVN